MGGRVVEHIGDMARVQVHISSNIERKESWRSGVGAENRPKIGMKRRRHLFID